MSRILQALKQLETRPAQAAPPPEAPAPVAPVAPPAPAVPSVPAAAALPPRLPAVTEPVVARVAPRRKKKKVRRAAEVEQRIAATAEEVAQLLEGLGPGVISCWEERSADSSAVIQTRGDAVPAAVTTQVMANDCLPNVIERTVTQPERQDPEPAPRAPATLEEIEQLLATLGPDVVAYWADQPFSTTAVVQADEDSSHAAEPVVVHDHLPTVIEIEVPASHPAVTPEAPALHESEVELTFQAKPRRNKRQSSRKTARPPRRELEVRKVVRGPQRETIVRPTAWETNIIADLDDPQRLAGLEQLLGHLQAQRIDAQPQRLLFASLGAPQTAAEAALRMATLLARREEESVLVVDADPEGALSKRLGIIGKPGLSDLLAPQDAHGETIYPTATARLHVLPRGRNVSSIGPSPSELAALLGELSQEYPWLLAVAGELDTPLTRVFAKAAQATYVVVPLRSSRTTAETALNHLRSAGARVVGAIVGD